MPQFRLASLSALALLLGLLAAAASAAEEKRTCPMGRDYYLYTPDDLDPARTYWLVVGVHGKGGNGKGACGMAGWVKKGNVIVVGPSFPDGYQMLKHDTDRQLVGLFAALHKEFRLYPNLFIYGFSGGSQYAHRFTLKYPEIVIGCAAHSGGTWSDELEPRAADVPMVISCGEKDLAKSMPDYPMHRYEWCQSFARKLDEAGFYFKVRFWPDVGHAASPGSARLTEECFNLATTGMHEDARLAFEKDVDNTKSLIAAGDCAKALEAVARLSEQARSAPASASSKPPDPKPADPKAGNLLPGLKENPYGWHEGQAAKAGMAYIRRGYIGQQAAALTQQIEKAALDKVAAIERAKPADAAAQLEALARTFASEPKVAAAIAQALARLKK